jgi:hypothetical protein
MTLSDRSKAVAVLLGGLVALIGSLTVLVNANGEIERMFRNSEAAIFKAMLLVLFALLCGYLIQAGLFDIDWAQTTFLVAGSVALVVAFGIGIHTLLDALNLPDRPTIDVTEQPSASNGLLTAQVITHKARPHDQIVVTVYGKKSDGTLREVSYAKTGPDGDGVLQYNVRTLLDPTKFEGVYVSAVVAPESSNTPEVDCDGFIVDADGRIELDGQNQKVPFRPNREDPLVACATAEFPTAQ